MCPQQEHGGPLESTKGLQCKGESLTGMAITSGQFQLLAQL